MNDALLENLLLIRQEIGVLNQAQNALIAQLSAIDQRLTQVEHCLVNLHNDASQSRSRAIWSDEDRTAFSNWLTTNTVADDGFPNLPG